MKKFLIWFIPGIIVGILIMVASGLAIKRTSTNDYCISCHIHPEADASWKQSVHYITKSGDRTACVECHLPPEGNGYLLAKVSTGLRDLWSYWTKDSASFNWEESGKLENARAHVYESSCIKCHENLFPLELTKDGEDAHLYYKQTEKTPDLHCINCHLNAGHFIKGYTHGSNKTFGSTSSEPKEIFTKPAVVSEFRSFNEYIPNSSVSFRMVAIPGGKFKLGSPENEPFRNKDEGPVRDVEISPFFMAEVEVTWNEFLAFYAQTSAEGRTTDSEGIRTGKTAGTDAISGATPPYGQPDQGWGLGQRPAISFTYHTAEIYCKWLSLVTGKTYRLPTEAEWEYACKAGSATPYFFPGNPEKYQKTGLRAKLSKNDTTIINSYIIYKENSHGKTQLPDIVRPNPFGLKNMTGNVAEFCSDWYQPDTYSQYPEGMIKDPKGPGAGEEHVIRGGSFMDMAGNLRSSARSYTRTADWLKTDPQIPKSIWWYSDCFHVGFRVVCEFDEKTGNL
ncbi:MAG TPA: SUMF1/EgtB/PvdO family nonheme iron enzyme [Bacteroidales bacterium]|jgi:formylglycine-generating enzyme required for sulfatase activity/nitrate/TMAO reductase-like tetraheme cytochrome c subunit|nr:SUMF1/EgtB/PvdO family nonheme iron enzyme [Bacteroidales bacterium]